MSALLSIFAFFQSKVDDLPPEVVDELPSDILQQLRDGVIDKIPEDVVDRLPEGVRDRVPEGLIEFASANPVLSVILVGLGVLGIVGFVYGVMKSAFKVAIFWAVLGGLSWWWFLQR